MSKSTTTNLYGGALKDEGFFYAPLKTATHLIPFTPAFDGIITAFIFLLWKATQFSERLPLKYALLDSDFKPIFEVSQTATVSKGGYSILRQGFDLAVGNLKKGSRYYLAITAEDSAPEVYLGANTLASDGLIDWSVGNFPDVPNPEAAEVSWAFKVEVTS